MAALTGLSDLVNRATGGNSGTPENLFFFKSGRIAGVAAASFASAYPTSLWLFDGTPSGAATPTTAIVPTNTTTGGLRQANPGGSREKWLLQFSAFASITSGTIVLYDRLFQIGGLSGTVTTAQTVQGSPASPALSRNTGGVGNLIAIEIYTQIGATATTVTAAYTNQAGSSKTTAASIIGGTNYREANRLLILPAAADDTGVQAVASVTLAATTGTAGNFGVVVLRPLAMITIGAPSMVGSKDFSVGLPGIPKIDTDACLGLFFIPNGTSPMEILGCTSMVEA